MIVSFKDCVSSVVTVVDDVVVLFRVVVSVIAIAATGLAAGATIFSSIALTLAFAAAGRVVVLISAVLTRTVVMGEGDGILATHKVNVSIKRSVA